MSSGRPKEQNNTSPLHGSLLRIGERREIAIYLRDGTAWVADFKGSHGEISTAGAWFALNQDRWAVRRATLDAVAPLHQDIEKRIERLHRRIEKPNDVPAIPQALAKLVAWLGGWVVKIRGALFGRRPAQPLDSADGCNYRAGGVALSPGYLLLAKMCCVRRVGSWSCGRNEIRRRLPGRNRTACAALRADGCGRDAA